MKKIILAIVVLLVSALGAASQDTIQSNDPLPNYFYNSWLDTNRTYRIVSAGWRRVFPWSHLDYNPYNPAINAKYFFTDDSLTIYGIAVMMDNAARGEEEQFVGDTSTKPSYEHFSIYRAGPEHPEPYSDSLRIHFFDSLPAYYLKMVFRDLAPDVSSQDIVEVHPVWEAYFNEPYTVKGSFYLAATSTCFRQNFRPSAPDFITYDHWPWMMVGFLPDYINMDYMTQPWPEKVCSYITDTGWVCDSMPTMLFFFPILTPNPADTAAADTTVVDTVGIAQRMLERYTGLQPNPAAERVQVLSSFGLTGVEVYNAAGIKVQEQKATGYVATLDVGALPAGPYLVRIKTPNGTATKKLLVQRR